MDDVSLGGDAPLAFAAPFMDLAMFGLHERVPDPKAKLEEVGVPPDPLVAPLHLMVCTWWGCEVLTQRPNSIG